MKRACLSFKELELIRQSLAHRLSCELVDGVDDQDYLITARTLLLAFDKMGHVIRIRERKKGQRRAAQASSE